MEEKTILVIDDDEVIRDLVEDTLQQNGFKAVTKDGGPAGLEHLENNAADLIILDRKMPEMDGNEVLEKLQSNDATKSIPVIMLTAQNNITDVSASLERGARDYIVKPFDHDNLIVRVKNVLR